MSKLVSASRLIERNFLWLAFLFSAAALYYPPAFTWAGPHISVLLGLIMFGMGLTIELSDFVAVWKQRRLLLAGVALHFTIMPFLGWFFATVFAMPYESFIGMVLVGSCPAGTASNVISYLARANVPLSVSMTLVSNALAPVMTPFIIYLILNHRVDVDMWGLMQSVFWVIAFPLFDGIVIRRFLRDRLKPFLAIFPSLSICALVFIIACIMGLNKKSLLEFHVVIFIAVMLHNLSGFALGYVTARLLGADIISARTICIEVGMQNSGLGVALAMKHFSAATALPSAIFSLWHNISGILLARRWREMGKGAR